MSHKGRTKDESFMIHLYEEVSHLPDIEDPIDRYLIGIKTGLHKTATDTICNLLAQANFIKKHGKIDIAITSQGIHLVEELKAE